MAKNQLESKDPREHCIIDTKTKSNKFTGIDFEYHDYNVLPEVKALKEKAAAGTLKDEYPGLPNNAYLCANANNWIDPKVHNKPEIVRYATDENGLIWIPKSDEATAKKLLKALRINDKGISVHPMGVQFEVDADTPVSTVKSKLRERMQSKG